MSRAQGGGARYRWAVLAAGTFAQVGYTALVVGLTVLAPALRARYGLSLPEVGAVIAAPNIGAIATLYPWGRAADRFGERAVIASGLGAAAACIGASASVSSFAALALLLVLAGAFGASVNSASGRAVMHWFDAESRGLALGLRQTAVPISGALTAVALPLLARHQDPKPALLALAALSVAGAAVALLVIREGPVPDPFPHAERPLSPLRDRRIWRLSAGAALMVQPQACLVGFLVVFLDVQRGMTTTTAAATLAVLNVLGIATRVGAGHWSDLARSRVRPLRQIALGSAALVAVCTLLESAPLAVLLPVLVLMGCVTISWNGLSFAATAEVAGHARSGAALGVQQTALALSSAVLPIAFGGLVAATSWRTGFALSALFPLAGWLVLRSIPGWASERMSTVSSRVIDRLDELYAIGATRVGGSAQEDAAHRLVAGWLAQAGLAVEVDAAGNTFGRRGAAAVWVGSHLDTVPDGGRFDGALGVVAAIEAAGRTEVPLAVVAFRDEERGCSGSRACVAAGGLPDAYLELHIEQGPLLERWEEPLGIVTAIFGQAQGELTFEGRADHAGTTPMEVRDDALVAAAEYVLRVREAALPGTVATVGRLRVEPGAANVVPARVTLTVDARAGTSEELDALIAAIGFAPSSRTEPVAMSGAPLEAVRAAAAGAPELVSGAGHDAGILAAAGVPCGMLFVRSLNGGVSHSPRELSSEGDIERAVEALARALDRIAS